MIKKIKFRVTAFIIAFVVCVYSPVSTVCHIQAQASQIVTSITWSVWQTIFASLGYTLGVTEIATSDAAAEDLKEQCITHIMNTNSVSREEAESIINGNVTFDGPAVKIGQKLWDMMRDFCGEKLSEEPPVSPISSLNFNNLSSTDFKNEIDKYLDLSVTAKNTSGYKSFIHYIYNNASVAANYGSKSFLIAKTSNGTTNLYHFYSFANSTGYYVDSSGTFKFSGYSNAYSTCSLSVSKSGQTVYSANTGFKNIPYDYLFPVYIVDGYMYDFKSVFPFNGRDASPVIYGTDLGYRDDLLGDKILNRTNTALTKSIPKLHAKGLYDVLTPGRSYSGEEEKVVGDVVLPIPANDILQQLVNGTITWEEFLEKIGATPVDTSTGTNILTDQFISTQQNIQANTAGILESLIALPTTLLNGIMGLFIPSDGFMQDKLVDMQDSLDDIGIVPYNLGDLFSSSNVNPFDDITAEIYEQEVVIVSFEHLPMFLDKFRPAIRGLMALFMLYYSINQLLGLLRIGGVIQGDNSNSSGGVPK